MIYSDISEVGSALVNCLQENLETTYPNISVIKAPSRQSFADLKYLGTCPPAVHVSPVLINDIECCRGQVKMNITWFFLIVANECGDFGRHEFTEKITTTLIKSLHCKLLCRELGFLPESGTAQPVGNLQSEQEGLAMYSYTAQSLVCLTN